MVPITIIDNFFDNPDQVRNIALSSDYERQDDSTFPGYRTKMIAEIDKTIYRTVMEKVLGLFWDLTRDELEVKFKTHFQFIPRQYGNGVGDRSRRPRRRVLGSLGSLALTRSSSASYTHLEG